MGPWWEYRGGVVACGGRVVAWGQGVGLSVGTVNCATHVKHASTAVDSMVQWFICFGSLGSLGSWHKKNPLV